MKMWLSDLSIRQPVFITMLVAAVLITGGLFYSRMAMDLLPDPCPSWQSKPSTPV